MGPKKKIVPQGGDGVRDTKWFEGEDIGPRKRWFAREEMGLRRGYCPRIRCFLGRK
jgi:hypothetical protein